MWSVAQSGSRIMLLWLLRIDRGVILNTSRPINDHHSTRACALLLEQIPVASIALPSSTRGRWHPNGCGLPGALKRSRFLALAYPNPNSVLSAEERAWERLLPQDGWYQKETSHSGAEQELHTRSSHFPPFHYLQLVVLCRSGICVCSAANRGFGQNSPAARASDRTWCHRSRRVHSADAESPARPVQKARSQGRRSARVCLSSRTSGSHPSRRTPRSLSRTMAAKARIQIPNT